VSGPRITRVGDASRGPSHDGLRLDFEEAIAFPGLINSHDHLEFDVYPALGHKVYRDHREWGDDIQRRDRDVISSLQRVPKSLRLRWGALKNLICGVTAVAHHGDLRDDLRALPIATLAGTSIHSVHAPRWRWRLNAPLGDSPYVFHVGEGTTSGARREIDELIRWNLFRKPLIGVHAIAMTSAQAHAFQAIVWCPLSNEFLYGATADVLALKGSTTVLFGTDSTLSADWNIWTHLRRARDLHVLDDRELFSAVTRTAAIAWGRPHMGRVAPGSAADLVVARQRTPDPWDAFFAVNPEDILLVLREGAVVLCDTSLDGITMSPPSSVVRIGVSTKRVATDAVRLLACMRDYGARSNLPIVAESSGPTSPV
jgi:cytosine/adenosine deaminase-related metal-dependent hydrolase